MATKKRRKTNAAVDVEPWASELEDIAKLQFSGKAVRDGHDFSSGATVPRDVVEVVEWLSQQSAATVRFAHTGLLRCCVLHLLLVQVNAHREKTISEIEMRAKEMRRCGATADWANVKDSRLREAAHGVNGPLLVGYLCRVFAFVSAACACECQESLAKDINYHDIGCIEMFRVGAPLLGKLECSGNGRRLTREERGESDLDQLDRDLGKRLLVFVCCTAWGRALVFAFQKPRDAEGPQGGRAF